MKKLFLLLPVLALTFAACNKESITETVQEENLNNAYRTAGAFVNPEEWVGVAHNEGLDHLINIESQEYGELVNFFVGYFDLTPSDFFDYADIQGDVNWILQDPDGFTANSNARQEVKDVFDEIDDIVDANNNVSVSIDVLAETTYLSNAYTDEEKEWLLGTMAVAKHSSNFWNEYDDLDDMGVSGAVKRADMRGFRRGWRMAENSNSGISEMHAATAMSTYLSAKKADLYNILNSN